MAKRNQCLKERSNHKLQAMLALFSTSNDSTLKFQKRQWQATYYSLLIFGVLFSCLTFLLNLKGDCSTVSCPRFVAYIVLWISAVIALDRTWKVLDELEKAINNARRTVDTAIDAIDDLSPRFLAANYPEGRPPDNDRTTLLYLFHSVLLWGFIIFTLLLFISVNEYLPAARAAA